MVRQQCWKYITACPGVLQRGRTISVEADAHRSEAGE